MEAWKDELYHYGVRGMKWKNKKEGSGSALANAHMQYGTNQALYGAREVAAGRDYDRQSVNYARGYQQKNARAQSTARAIASGRRPGSRVKNDGLATTGIGLHRRGSGLGTRVGTGNATRRASSGKYSGAQSPRKRRVAKYVKRALS